MAATQFSKFFHQLRGVLAQPDIVGLTDADLWQRYVQERDASAFEVLVRRHGPMVLNVCRRTLRNEADAEDAFQATFLVLIRRGASLRSPHTLANWLHGVAYRTALEARRLAARRKAREAALAPLTVMPEDPLAELWPVLDHELGQLPEKYRAVVALCDLGGKTRKEAACQLGCAAGTVASRLARGRSLLAKRLERRGFTGAMTALALADGAVEACLPAKLMISTLTIASEKAKVILSARVIALTEGVLRAMLLTKLKTSIVAALLIGIATIGAGSLFLRSLAAEPPAKPADKQEQPQTKREDLHERVVEMKQRLQEMQKKLAKLEEETQPKREEKDSFVADHFKYRIEFETGYTESKEGGRIEIREVWGTRPKIEVGGQYLVRGKYVLPKGEQGWLYFFETPEGAWGQGPTANLDLQYTSLDKQEGEFTLVHGMAGPGYFHLYLSAKESYSRTFANVYFGTGDNVWRKKP